MIRASAALAVALVVLAGGCASMRAARARQQALQTQLDALQLGKPLDEVWPEVRRLLHAQRYGLVGKDAEALGVDVPSGLLTLISVAKETQSNGSGGRFLETGWGPGVLRKRYRAEGIPTAAGCRVVFTAIPEDMTERGRDAREKARDLEMELLLAWRVDPVAAERIEGSLPDASEAAVGPAR